MRANTRVKVSGLQSRPELNGKQGVAQYYAPTTGKHGRYLVTIDGTDENLGIKLENLKPLVHEEERSGDKDGLGETITVNGLTYCAEHRMEICGACSFNFRILNRMAQLQPGDDLHDRAYKVDEEEAARNEPPLRAPTRHAESPSAPVVLNSKAKPPRGIDPSALPAWPRTVQRSAQRPMGAARGPLEAAFINVFSLKEKLMSQTGEGPSPAEDPLYHIKESMVAMAARVEERLEQKKPTPRFILQDSAQTEAIMIDVIDVRVIKAAAGDQEAVPALVVRYWYCTASNMRKMVKNMEASMRMKVASDCAMGFSERESRESGMQNMPSHLLEIKGMRTILEENHARLDPAFIASASKGLVADWRVSILQPVPKEGVKTAVVKESCALCGKAEEAGGVPLKACARCKVQKYCSKECQKADWKQHKKTCVAPEAEAEAEIIEVDLAVDVMAARGMPSSMFMGLMNLNGSSRAGYDSSRTRKCGEIEGIPAADKMFVVKIQVPMEIGMGMDHPSTGLMMCYNQGRDVHCQIAPENCDGGQRAAARLAHIVRSGGVAQGMKGYFNAYITDKKLRILAHKPLPLQPW